MFAGIWASLAQLRPVGILEASCGVLVGLVTYGTGLAIYRLHFSPIAKFPGPKLAALTSWYECFWDINGGQFPNVIEELHKTYGPIIRVNPDELSILDPDYYNELYVSAGKRRSNTSDATRAGIGVDGAIATTSDHGVHSMRRKAMESLFSRQSITRVESRVHEEAKLLDEKLQQLKGTEKVVSLDHAFLCITGDVVGGIACGENPRLIEEPDFNPDWHKSLMGMLNMMPYARNFTWLNHVMNLVPEQLLEAMMPQLASLKAFHTFVQGRIQAIKDNPKTESEGEEKATSLVHHILRSDLPESEKSTARLNNEAASLVAAGTITTAETMKLITYYVLEDPAMEKRLRDELENATACYPERVPRWTELEKVPYLAACIKEGLRLSRFMRRNVRISPDEDLHYKGWIIPKNTPVGMHITHMHMDPDVFPEPDRFIPERWLGDYDPRMNRNYVPFVRGSRSCIGLNLAYAEMYVFLGMLFRPGAHHLSLECDESDIAPVRDHDIGIPKAGARGLRVRVH